MSSLCFVLVAIFFSISIAQQPSPVPYVSPGSCTEGVELFQSTTLTCVACGANEVPSDDGNDWSRLECDWCYAHPCGCVCKCSVDVLCVACGVCVLLCCHGNWIALVIAFRNTVYMCT